MVSQRKKKKKGKLLGKKMERRSERSNKNNQRQAGKEQSQSWIWERSGELASEGDIGMQWYGLVSWNETIVLP